ncbi:MAG: hypothetical protein JW956_00290 [Calditrichaceae bacterium]|nr:hypothetical protein [Calditrichaceae bacterium]
MVTVLSRFYNSAEYRLDYNPGKNTIRVFDLSDQVHAHIRLPWASPAFSNLNDLKRHISENQMQTLAYIIILIQAGYCAVGHCRNGEILAHKLIRKYMVRKKQGKAQITYLNTKGKSRAGSRIRLAQTVQFFEEINQQINNWMQNFKPDRLLMSCPPRLWGLLFQSKIKPEFLKKDKRLFKIPIDIKIPDKNELIRVNHLAQKCIIEFDNTIDMDSMVKIII